MNGGRMLLVASAWLAAAPALAQDGVVTAQVPTCKVMMNGKAGPEFVVRPCPEQAPVYAGTTSPTPALEAPAQPAAAPAIDARPDSPTPAQPADGPALRPTRTERPAKLS
jgi:hypothetical protein